MLNRKRTVFFCILILLTIFRLPAFADERPNIVFLMTDDQSTYSLGCYGNSDVKTPNLDRLAAAGVVFDRHYANTAICMASRATVMTGLYEYRTGCNFTHGSMLESTWKRSYPVLLRDAGYRTAFAGKFGFETKANPDDKDNLPLPSDDFDMWGGGPGQTNYATKHNESMKSYAKEFPHSTLSYGAFGRDFINQSAKLNQPFCLSISFKAPHKPARPDRRFDHVYKDATFRKPLNYGREAGAHFSPQSKTDRQYERFHSWKYADRYDEVMATYHQQIHGVDAAVGMIVKALEASGAAENTVIIFTSDNGFLCGSHGYGSKVLPYEEASHVPLIMFDPREENSGKQLRCDALSGLIDIAPTILDLASIEIPEPVDGASLVSLYRDPKSSIHDDITLTNVWGHPATHSLSVVTRDKKYIYWAYAGGGMQAAEELYDLGSDSLEMQNVAKRSGYESTMNEMRQRYDQHVRAWKSDAVPFHNYQQYGTIFDRHLDWDSKKDLYPNKKPAKKPQQKPN
ncbi:sulfatase family protein [Mariniblastus fucicola]|uniref:Arylsulfatase n=1 Tax=Mariniblastus fucicola TaxID=980251 RepID=A0A5B9PMT4_9BACT|nr:sulfatase [Mariniblastus fucicola]QEG23623.1 Arylsulfatase [Mariniblastus fucicola]